MVSSYDNQTFSHNFSKYSNKNKNSKAYLGITIHQHELSCLRGLQFGILYPYCQQQLFASSLLENCGNIFKMDIPAVMAIGSIELNIL